MAAFFESDSIGRQALIGSGLLVVTFLVGFFADPHGLRKLSSLGDQVVQEEAENDRLRAEIDVLRRKAKALHGDPAALERAARESGYVRSGEILFELRGVAR